MVVIVPVLVAALVNGNDAVSVSAPRAPRAAKEGSGREGTRSRVMAPQQAAGGRRGVSVPVSRRRCGSGPPA